MGKRGQRRNPGFVREIGLFERGPGQIRTADTRFRKPPLYPLSYEGGGPFSAYLVILYRGCTAEGGAVFSCHHCYPAAAGAYRIAATVTDMKHNWMTITDVSEELGVSRSTLYKWVALGKGPTFKKLPNGSLRVRRDEFDEWVERLPEVA